LDSRPHLKENQTESSGSCIQNKQENFSHHNSAQEKQNKLRRRLNKWARKLIRTGLRIGVIKDWESRWYADKKNFSDNLVEDYKLREYLLATLAPAGVPKVEIERDAKRVYITIHCAKPGMVIGRGGSEIEKLKEICKEMLGGDKEVAINIVEVKAPELDAQLVAENIAQQLEKTNFIPSCYEAVNR
jgi:ribosomal protein S3